MNIPTLTFLLQEKKLKKDGNAPIYLRITINGTRSEVSTKIDIEPSKWDSKKELIKGKEPLTILHMPMKLTPCRRWKLTP
jgi:hypothetical protein